MASSEGTGEGVSGVVRGSTRPAGRGDEKEVLVLVRIKYRGELPADIDELLAQRAYDVAHARGKNVYARVTAATVVEEA